MENKNDLISKLHKLELKEKDIIIVQLTEKYYSPTNAKHIVDNLKNILQTVAVKKQIGILVVKEPSDVVVIDDDQLLNLGLIKLHRLAMTNDESEYKEIMKKMGFTEIIPFEEAVTKDAQVNEKPISERKYIIHSTPDFTMAQLAYLYGVDISECVDANDPLLNLNKNAKQLFYHLYPRLDNNYTLPKNKGQ